MTMNAQRHRLEEAAQAGWEIQWDTAAGDRQRRPTYQRRLDGTGQQQLGGA